MKLIPVKIDIGDLLPSELSRLIRDLKKIQKRYVVMSKNPSDPPYVNEVIKKLEEIEKEYIISKRE